MKSQQYPSTNSNKSIRFVQSLLDSPSGFSQKAIVVGSRNFSLKILEFNNGYFVSISESSDKLGSMVISMATGPAPVTTTIIPSRSESLFLKLTAERISTRMKGIAIVSSFIQKELEQQTAKALMTEIMDMIQNE